MLSTIYILLTALGDDEGYLPRVYREAISCFGTFRKSRDVRVESVMRSKADLNRDLADQTQMPATKAREESRLPAYL